MAKDKTISKQKDIADKLVNAIRQNARDVQEILETIQKTLKSANTKDEKYASLIGKLQKLSEDANAAFNKFQGRI